MCVFVNGGRPEKAPKKETELRAASDSVHVCSIEQ